MTTTRVLFITGLLIGTSALAQRPRIDTDGDGAISLPELQAVRPNVTAEQFSRLDSDGNGLVSMEEMRSARAERGPGRRPGMQIDTDGDGAVSLAELQAARPGVTEESFNEMDTNGDGLITPDERPRGGRRPFGGPPPGGERGFGPAEDGETVL